MNDAEDHINLFLFSLEPSSCLPSADVSEEPEIRLTQWSIRQDQFGNCYFVGAREDGTGRASTPIVEFDAGTRRGRTMSGRVYELVGPQGRSRNAEYIWSIYRQANGIEEKQNGDASKAPQDLASLAPKVPGSAVDG